MTVAYELNDNSGSLFANDKRETDRHPNAKGKAMIGGVMYLVSAWTKTSQSGTRWQSLSFTPMEEQHQHERPVQRPHHNTTPLRPAANAASQRMQAPAGEDFSDEIPFAPHMKRAEYLV